MDEGAGIHEFRVELLNQRHDRKRFTCNNDKLDLYLRTMARQDVAKFVAAVYVLTRDGRTVAGFYSLSQHSLDLRSLPEGHNLPKYPDVPVTLLGRFAIDIHFQGIGLGGFLLVDALKRSLAISSVVASAMVLVEAKDEAAKHFYESRGFESLRKFPNRLVIPMDTIERMTRESHE
jgi:ribosomal protein S18 acetylase RimI-like enzyme